MPQMFDVCLLAIGVHTIQIVRNLGVNLGILVPRTS